jgi:hypothetical protein
MDINSKDINNSIKAILHHTGDIKADIIISHRHTESMDSSNKATDLPMASSNKATDLLTASNTEDMDSNNHNSMVDMAVNREVMAADMEDMAARSEDMDMEVKTSRMT